MHVADVDMLHADMVRTIYYLHTQPPLFNIVFGVTLKIFPEHWASALRVVWLGLGLCMALSLHELMLRLRVGPAVALGVVSLLLISPATILYENWLFYDYPITAMLCVAALLLHIYLERGRTAHLVAFFSVLSAIMLTRSLFHLAWMAAIVALLALALPGRRTRILIAALLPFVMAALPYVRNLLLFDEFSCSTWLGPSLAKMTVCRLDTAEREAAVACGDLTPVSLVPPYSPIDAYPCRGVTTVRTGIPVLDALRKGSGATNFNSLACLDISRAYRRDAVTVLRAHPALYAAAVVRSTFYYCYPASVNFMMGDNRSAIAGYERAFDLVIYGQLFDYQSVGDTALRDTHGVPKIFKIGLFIVAGMLVAIPFGVVYARRMLRPGGHRSDGLTLAVVIGTILWVTVVGNLLEIGENYRFRFMIDPFYHLLLALFLTGLLARRRAARLAAGLRHRR